MLLITVSHSDSQILVAGLLNACRQQTTAVSIFFTGQGVKMLDNDRVLAALACAKESIACAESWSDWSEAGCPVTEGSQTEHSRLIGQATHLVGF